ncbi:uncharacterized protein LOC134262785 [Saccostrea cucullata]|uniref:uncharacterized protein LOC134262785 n=1 Tax=Saccostrea cuccullata TaxID=36930 RepID=UPI002ED42E31
MKVESRNYQHDESVTHAVALTATDCRDDFDCTSHVCPKEARFPYCRSHHGFFSHHTRTCDCIACLSDKDCTCPAGKTPHCEHNSDDVHQRNCQCSPTNFTTTVQSTTMKTSSPETTTSTRSVPSTSPSSHNNPPIFAGVRKCHTCRDANSSISCDTRTIYLGNLQNCASNEHFCMTDIVHDGSGNTQTYKRCVTEEECRNKWLHQTSDLEYCTNYGNVPMTGQYSCHFCCVTDECNAGQVPDKSTYYTKA